MREPAELHVDEPADDLQEQGVAAIVSSEAEDWCFGVDPLTCRELARRLLELAADHERKFGKAMVA